ncbi:MerR family DNA-binding transcriptional regulator [Enterococcus durans]|uniref:MerR family DNA-binding transcriptional regulator n=1 Tax=Enterococcus durans TaxID=53345 RepID=UPI00288FF70A|nr:MerR family DNA-binding transcriptional regulator [Enterococcus durans]MDT2772081.1 MerR family DNA-binding transcriptional regulator [Enterococcus durans]
MVQEHEKIEENLYRIGMFSKMNQITIKTLRYYDEVGLLHPRFIDPDNGLPLLYFESISPTTSHNGLTKYRL